MPDASSSESPKEPYQIKPGDCVIWRPYECVGELCGPVEVLQRFEDGGKPWLLLADNPRGTLAISLSLVRKVKRKEEKGI